MIEAIESKLRAHLIRTSLLSARHSTTGVLARLGILGSDHHPIDESKRDSGSHVFHSAEHCSREPTATAPDRSHMCIGSQCFALGYLRCT